MPTNLSFNAALSGALSAREHADALPGFTFPVRITTTYPHADWKKVKHTFTMHARRAMTLSSRRLMVAPVGDFLYDPDMKSWWSATKTTKPVATKPSTTPSSTSSGVMPYDPETMISVDESWMSSEKKE